MRCWKSAGDARWATVALLPLLLAAAGCARAAAPPPIEHEQIAPGICPSMDIRSTVDQLLRLRGCRIIEGHLTIVLLERTNASSFENISFPELTEVTGYVKIYRIRGIRNLGSLFPNLSVIRGLQLFKDFALIIFDNENLEFVGLYSLSKIERGAVRIQNNDHLCYTNTIDWSAIMKDNTDNNIIKNNYDLRLCGVCPNAQSRKEESQHQSQCPTDSKGHLLCWDDTNCQKQCPVSCGDSGCLPTAEKTCCHKSCLGGCEGPHRTQCRACRHLSTGYGRERSCVDHCPAGTYQLFRRCVTEQECRSIPPPMGDANNLVDVSPMANIPAYKIHNNTCTYMCPNGYMEEGNIYNSSCKPCPSSGCVSECVGGKIDSLMATEQFRGCTHVKGDLVISLRASGGNTIGILEQSLSEIRVIEGALRVTRSYPLVSLMFLKKLELITGNAKDKKGHSLYIFNNPNLELLWDWPTHGNISIAQGKPFIHFNPKLCYNKILPLQTMIPSRHFTENEVSEENNGDQASCSPDVLKLEVQSIHRTNVVLKWDNYCMTDIRKLLGYSVYYIVAETNVTLYGQRDACSDSWNAIDINNELKTNKTAKTENLKTALKDPCDEVQPVFQLITHLAPYTRYAAYVKTYTTLQNKKDAQSSIIYFRTLPGHPSPPVALSVEPVNAHTVTVKWAPPSITNGTIILYHVEIQANTYNMRKILTGNVNYCAYPYALVNMITVRGEDLYEKPGVSPTTGGNNVAGAGSAVAGGAGSAGGTGDVRAGQCACAADRGPEVKFDSRSEADRTETIDFENQLQNAVYKKKVPQKSPPPQTLNRWKRSVDNSVNSMLVILSPFESPKPGNSYTNATEDGYVKSMYYSMGGGATSLRVTNLRHFTWYTVNVWACRARQDNESSHAYNESWCSDRAKYNFRTLELLDVDKVSKVQAAVLPSNKTVEVNITWEPPKNPNGFVVAYSVYHSRIDNHNQANEVSLQSCITADEYESGGRGYVLRGLQPGEYSVRVAPITMSGAGNLSVLVHFQIPERTSETGYDWVYGVVGGLILVVIISIAGIWYARREMMPPAEANKLIATVNPEYVSTMYVPDEWEVPRENIKFLKELGQGSFGMVYEGIAKNIEKGKAETRCAVKTVNEHATDRERIEFLNEASVMKAFDTHHVVRLLGVVSRAQPTLVVMELMECGDLKTYLRSHRPDADSSLPRKGPDNPPTLQNILQMAIEIADGMAYLSAKKFVHRDLAARNCMVAGDLTVKVGDFGMTRDIYETDYYRKGSKGLLPVRWMSPESLKDGVFSSYSDVWSFGVVLWEMATLAMQPYQGLSNEQVVRYVGEGGVMERPEHCPDRLYELMRACWAHRPAVRPAFLRLVADLAPTAAPYFRHRSFFHSPQGQEFYAMQKTSTDEEQEMPEVNVGAVASGSGSNLFGVSGRLASWVRELSLRSRSGDAAAEPLRPLHPTNPHSPRSTRPNGALPDPC